jgi:hypothetical protein
VTRDHQQVSVEREDQNGKWPSSLRKQAFLNFISFHDGEPRTEDRFYSLLPYLTRAAADYERVNEFARTFALLRWAHDAGATFVKATLPSVPAADPLGSVIVSPKGIVEGPRCRRVDAIDEQRIKIEQAIARILNGAPPNVKHLDAALARDQSNALTMAVQVQEDAQWGATPAPKRTWLQRLRGLVNRRAAPPTPEAAIAAVRAAAPSAKPIVDTMVNIAGEPIKTQYKEATREDGAEVAVFLAVDKLLPSKWDWYSQWYFLRGLEVDLVH